MEYISYNVGTRDFPDIYAHALGPAALGLGHIYQANPSCPCYNYYIYTYLPGLVYTYIPTQDLNNIMCNILNRLWVQMLDETLSFMFLEAFHYIFLL